MTKFGVGQAAARIEDRVLVTGAGAYTDDTSIDGQAWAHVLRSPHAHARILGIDTSDAVASPGVVGILTGADMTADGLGDLPCMIPVENRDGSQRPDSPHGILAKERVRYVGHPVAFVVAETPAQARDAAERIAVDYEELPATVHTEHSTAADAPLLYDHIPNNLIYDWHKGDEAGVEAALAAADHVCELRLVNNRVVANPMEPRSALAMHDEATGRTTLATSTQGPSLVRDILAEPVFGIDPSNLRITTGHVGGGFGMKVFPHPEQALAIWAARRLKRPVKWTSERSEGFLSDVQARDNITYCKLGLDRNGRILALRADTFANEGAYLSAFAPLVACDGMDMLVGLYDIPVIYTTVKGVLTNTVPVDAYRGAGRPEAAYIVERLIDKAGRETGLPVDEIRRINFIRPEQMPYATCLGDTYDSGAFEALMDEAMVQADWAGFEARRAESAKRGKYRGIGLATYIERCGGGPPETAAGSFGDDDILTVAIGTMDNGQGHQTAYSQILSGELGIDAENIRIFQGDSDRAPPGMTGGSRSVPVGGAAMLGLAATIVDKGRRTAADMLEAAAADNRIWRRLLSGRRHRQGSVAVRGRPPGEGEWRTAGRQLRTDAGSRDLSQRRPCRRAGGRQRNGRDRDPALYGGRRFRRHHQPAVAGRPGAWRDRAGAGPGVARVYMVRSGERPARNRVVHGLQYAQGGLFSRSSASAPATCAAPPTRSASRARARPARSARPRPRSTPWSMPCAR